MVGIFRVANAGHGLSGADFFCHQAAEHIGQVVGGDGHQQIGALDARVLLNPHSGAVASHGHHVIEVGKLLQHPLIGIDNHNVVILLGQQAGQHGADLAAAHNNDFHNVSPSGAGVLRRKRAVEAAGQIDVYHTV